MRSKNIDTRANCGFNLINGNDRRSVEVPSHRIYNPPDTFQTLGSQILGSGYAGKPLRPDWFKQPRAPSTQQYGVRGENLFDNPYAYDNGSGNNGNY